MMDFNWEAGRSHLLVGGGQKKGGAGIDQGGWEGGREGGVLGGRGVGLPGG